MGNTDEGEKPQQMLKPIAAEKSTQGVASPLGSSRLHKHEGGRSDETIFGLCLRSGPFPNCWKRLQRTQHDLKVAVPWWRHFQKIDRLLDRLNDNRGVTGRVASPHKKGAMAHDAITNLAEARKVDEQSLLKQRRDGVIEVCRLGEFPQSFDDFGRVRRRREKIWHQAKAAGDLTLEGRLSA